MTQLSRRGFLGTMLAAAIGAAASFDPTRKLWVPASVQAAITPEAVAQPLVTEATPLQVEQQLELQDLALRFARAMGQRLERHRSVVLREVMCERAGHINLGALRVDTLGSGVFTPPPFRIVKALPLSATASPAQVKDYLEQTAGQMVGAVREYDMFAPIGAELRQGVPFTDALVAVATDPETGLSARAIRYTQRGGVIGPGEMTSVELAVGHWIGQGARARRRRERGLETPKILLSPEFLVGATDEADVLASESEWRG